MLKKISILFLHIVCLCVCVTLQAQNNAQISSSELIFDFGNIEEADGPTSHVFTVKNTGSTPLVITRITASCGCTQPEWSKEPIGAGKTGEVKVTYNPKGRPGPFYKTISIFSNGKKGSYSLGIKGNVNPKPIKPIFIYPYSIGNLKLQSKQILFSTIRSKETLAEKINILNEGETSMTIHLGKAPSFFNINVSPTKIAPQETADITVLMNAAEVKKKGRISAEIPMMIDVVGESKPIESSIIVTANIIDDFDKLSSAEKENAPIAKLSGNELSFGKLPNKNSFIPLIGGKITGTIEIENEGKTPLIIHSATCDDERIDITGGKKEIKPGNKAVFKISLKPKEIKTKLESLIVFVCNDPSGPVRFVKVTGEK